MIIIFTSYFKLAYYINLPLWESFFLYFVYTVSCDVSKPQLTCNGLHGIKSKKIGLFVTNTVRT
jgi:hypothetical protein